MRIPGPGEPRPTPTLWAAAVGSGVVDLVDMLLPLWAGAGLALTGTGAGILTAMLPLGSLAGRPLAGRLVDDGHRAAPLIGGLFAGALGAALLAATSGRGSRVSVHWSSGWGSGSCSSRRWRSWPIGLQAGRMPGSPSFSPGRVGARSSPSS